MLITQSSWKEILNHYDKLGEKNTEQRIKTVCFSTFKQTKPKTTQKVKFKGQECGFRSSL